MLISKFEKTKEQTVKDEIVKFYLNHLQFINNWDLVDTSCYKILGRYAFENQKENLLKNLADSDQMWYKRIAVVGTMHYIKKVLLI